MGGHRDADAAVGEVLVVDATAEDVARRVAVRILVGEHALQVARGELGVERGEAVAVAHDVAVAEAADARPARAEDAGALEPDVGEEVEVGVRRAEAHAAQVGVGARGGRVRLHGEHRRGARGGLGAVLDERDGVAERGARAGCEVGVVLQDEADLLAAAVRIPAAAVLLERLGLGEVAVDADEGVLARVEAGAGRVAGEEDVGLALLRAAERGGAGRDDAVQRRVPAGRAGVVALDVVGAVDVGAVVGDDAEAARAARAVLERDVPDLAAVLGVDVGGEAHRDAVERRLDHGEARPVRAGEALVLAREREAVGGPPAAGLGVDDEHVAAGDDREAAAEVVLREPLAEGGLREAGDVAVVEEVVVPVARGPGRGDRERAVRVEVSEAGVFHGAHSSRSHRLRATRARGRAAEGRTVRASVHAPTREVGGESGLW